MLKFMEIVANLPADSTDLLDKEEPATSVEQTKAEPLRKLSWRRWRHLQTECFEVNLIFQPKRQGPEEFNSRGGAGTPLYGL